MNHQPTSQSLSRVMTLSDLSSSKPHNLDNQPSYTMPSRQIGQSRLVFGAGEKQGNESDTSSICRSPGWEDSKNRKKEKQDTKDMRRRKKEKEDMEHREMRQPGRLTKAPPTSRGISKLSSPMIRSGSAPVLHTFAVKATGKSNVQSSSERTSNDAESRKVTPWKSANNMTVLEAEEPEHRSFIGGLKLQQATQATAQQTFRKQMSRAVNIHRSNFIEEFEVGEDGSRKPFDKLQGGLDLIEPKDKASDDKSISSRVSKKPENSEEPSEAYVPTIERSIRRARKGRSSGSESCIQQAHTLKYITLGSEASQDVALLRTQIAHSSPRKSSKPSPNQPSVGPPISYREPSQLADAEPRPRRSSFSFLRPERQHSKSKSTLSCQEGSRLATATSRRSTESRARSWSFTKSSRTSISRPTTADSFRSKHSISNDAYRTSFDSDGLLASSERAGSSNKSLPPSGKASRAIHLQGLMAAAKAALSRSTRSPSSLLDPSKSFTAEKVRQTAVSPASPNQVLHSESPSPRRTEKCLPQETAASNAYNPDGTLNEKIGQSSKSSFSSGSSEEYHSILNETDTWSMPAASEPQLIASNARTGEDTEAKSRPTTSTTQLPIDKVMDAAMQYESSNSKASGSSLTSTGFPSSVQTENLSFLPPLRHRTLRRPAKGNDKEISSANYSQTMRWNPPAHHKGPLLSSPPRSSSFFTSTPTPPNGTKPHSARYLHNERQNIPPSSSSSRVSLNSASKQDSNTRAKMFVVCCNCHYFHDMPSKIYECMVKPDNVVTDPDLGVSGVISTRVKCPWCAHGMSSTCCEGWATVVIMKERLH